MAVMIGVTSILSEVVSGHVKVHGWWWWFRRWVLVNADVFISFALVGRNRKSRSHPICGVTRVCVCVRDDQGYDMLPAHMSWGWVSGFSLSCLFAPLLQWQKMSALSLSLSLTLSLLFLELSLYTPKSICLDYSVCPFPYVNIFPKYYPFLLSLTYLIFSLLYFFFPSSSSLSLFVFPHLTSKMAARQKLAAAFPDPKGCDYVSFCLPACLRRHIDMSMSTTANDFYNSDNTDLQKDLPEKIRAFGLLRTASLQAFVSPDAGALAKC